MKDICSTIQSAEESCVGQKKTVGVYKIIIPFNVSMNICWSCVWSYDIEQPQAYFWQA